MENPKVTDLIGKTLKSAVGKKGDDDLTLTTVDGVVFHFHHTQECCEGVQIEDVNGDLNDLIGSPITAAEESTNQDDDPPLLPDSWTWTFYRFATVKGFVVVRWLGESNGYYSESVDLEVYQEK